MRISADIHDQISRAGQLLRNRRSRCTWPRQRLAVRGMFPARGPACAGAWQRDAPRFEADQVSCNLLKRDMRAFQ